VRHDDAQHSVWRQAFESALHIEWPNVEPAAALRCAAGVGVALGGALVFNRPTAGVFLAVGAVAAGFGSFQGAYRSRAAIMLLAAGGMAISLFAGSLAGRSTLIDCAIAGGWALGAGLFVALGPAAAFIGLQSTVAVLVATAYPTDLEGAAGRALLVLAGGTIQTLLVVMFWPLRRFHAERTAIARAYNSLAAYAESLAHTSDAPPEPHTFAAIKPVHADPQPFARTSEVLVFVALLDEGDRIRTTLAALTLASADERRTVAEHAAPILRELAASVDDGRAPAKLTESWSALQQRADQPPPGVSPLRTLLGQLRAACRTASVPALDPPPDSAPSQPARTIPPVRDALMTLRSNLTLRSTTFRHALRLSFAVTVAMAIYRITALPRGYWFPMTTLLVLKPEYRETFVTGITRIAATLAGATFAGAVVVGIGDHPAILSALLLLFVWGGYAIFRANYALFTICITGYIVVLMHLAGTATPTIATYRALDTALGGALALLVYRLWPTWEAGRTRDLLAQLSETLADDARLVIGMYVDPSTWDTAKLQQSRAAARLARSNTEASVTRLLVEPERTSRLDAQLATSLLAAFRRYALGALVLHWGLDQRPAKPVPELTTIRDQIAEGLEAIAAALRHGGRPALPPLAETQASLEHALERAMAEQLSMMTDSVTTAGSLLGAGSEQ
jgi:uncharacterized membrane protein YgaE (UPF0421/DUF939 family)